MKPTVEHSYAARLELACAVWSFRLSDYAKLAFGSGDAPDFVEVGEAGIAVDHAMRRQRAVQHSW